MRRDKTPGCLVGNRKSEQPIRYLRGVASRILSALGSILVAGLMLTASAFAQTTQVSGLITDSSGGRVPKANVAVLNNDTGINRTTAR